MTIPYLINFKPYTFVGELCQSIDDMVSINLQQQFSFSEINYDVGSGDDINLPLIIKNITNNANVSVELNIDENVFIVNDGGLTLTLAPGQTQQINISLNKQKLNETVGLRNSDIGLTIKNITNGTIVTRNIEVSKLEPQYITDTLL